MKLHEVLPKIFEEYMRDPYKVKEGKEVEVTFGERCTDLNEDSHRDICYKGVLIGHLFYRGKTLLNQQHGYCFVPEKEFRPFSHSDIKNLIARTSVEEIKKRKKYTRKQIPSAAD